MSIGFFNLIFSDGIYSSAAMYSFFRSPKNNARVKDFRKFKDDARLGRLPQYSYIDPDFQKSNART
jgi:hypothetical protein